MTRGRRSRDDDGFALPFVLLVIMMVTIAVTALLTVTTPNIGRAVTDQNAQTAAAAARAGIDDAEAWLESVDLCRSTTRVCAQGLGADSASLTRPALAGLPAAVRWTTDSAVTPDGFVRVRSTAVVSGTSRTVVGDLALAPSILSFGYYSDYESQSPSALMESSPARGVYFDSDNGTNYTQYINAVSSSTGRATTVSAPVTATWDGVSTADTAICGRHWWNDGATPGRGRTYTTPGASAYTESAALSTSGLRAIARAGSCDVVFTTGQTFDGPVYSRDAIYISNGSGSGPVFRQPVVTGWGYADHTTPAPGSQNWLGDNPTASPNKPTPARFDLQLPSSIGTEGVAANACVYTGPTRVVLNSNGTASVTSPRTTTANAASDPACYPNPIPTGGIVAFAVPVNVGGGTVVARTLGSAPATGTAWPTTGTKSTIPATAANSVFYQANTTGATTPDQANSSTLPSAAWTKNWTASSTGTCNGTYQATDQRLFECEYSFGSTKQNSQPGKTFPTFQTAVTNAVQAGTCLTGTAATQAGCLTTLVNGLLPKPSGAAYAARVTPGTATTRSQAVGPTPPSPSLSTDPLFTSPTGTPAQETGTSQPMTVAVTRTATGGSAVAQTTFVVTQSTWAITATALAASYFPNTADVTPYATSVGTNVPGDLYVQGTNHGKRSLLADNDVVVTGNVVDAGTDTDVDALNLTAGGDIRNYNPVSCLSTAVATAVTATAAGFCPNDLTGLTTNSLAGGGALSQYHPARQYVNLNPVADREIDAALFALTGSLRSDNFNRGVKMGNLLVRGGLYQSHRGANGQNVGAGGSAIVQLGYYLNYQYVDLRKAQLPYEPTTRTRTGRVWSVVSISANGPS